MQDELRERLGQLAYEAVRPRFRFRTEPWPGLNEWDREGFRVIAAAVAGAIVQCAPLVPLEQQLNVCQQKLDDVAGRAVDAASEGRMGVADKLAADATLLEQRRDAMRAVLNHFGRYRVHADG